jgi:DNA repair protein REV1
MWMKGAQQLCPDLKVLPYDFQAYEEASRSFYDAMLSTDGVVQSVSVDEALVDLTAACIPRVGMKAKGFRKEHLAEQAKADEVAQGPESKSNIPQAALFCRHWRQHLACQGCIEESKACRPVPDQA